MFFALALYLFPRSSYYLQQFMIVRSRKSRLPKTRNPKVSLWLLVAAISFGVGFRQVQSHVVQPEAIFVLGGHESRERFAAQLASRYPELPIWISSGSPEAYVRKIFAKAGIEGDRLHLDYRATDTVTNFTTLVDRLEAQGISSVYLVTSDNHMRRARLVGEIVFGSQGIDLKPVPVSSQAPVESPVKSLRDGARALLWVATGHTGMSLRTWRIGR